MKPITKQLTMAALVLASVAVLSFGIKQVRFHLHRARNAASAPKSAQPASPPREGASGQSSADKLSDDDAWLEQTLDALAAQGYRPADLDTLLTESYSEYADASGRDAWASDEIEAYEDSGEQADNVAGSKSLKGEFAKYKKSLKGLQKVSIGDYENVYITDAGEYWYVSKQPDGTTTKMQFQVDDRYGDVVVVGTGEAGVYRPGAGGKNSLQRISVGANEDVYITETGEHWYVSTQPDGTTTKMQFQVEDSDGEVVIVETEESQVYPSK
ncbi:MAG: hypothetical protein JSW66_09805 [Phycisphaerales bacterium]|nr:MAG: hypothetical protein JSW66_09805 [Phycisphaerales bacterium]